MAESLQHKLDRIRRPRVQITYDVEIGGAIERRELAFVVGVLADLSGVRDDPLPPVRERKFIELDRDNFDHVLQAIAPHAHVVVPNRLGTEGEDIAFDLYFHCFEDFSPLPIVKQIPELQELYETRTRCKDLLTKLDGNDALSHLLADIVNDPEKRNALKAELGQSQTASQTAAPSPETTAESAPESPTEAPKE